MDDHFNPYHVKKNVDVIAHAISKKLDNKTYEPKSALSIELEKPRGGRRRITIFTIPASAISRLFHERLIQLNVVNFSDHSYAYRPDKNAHDATRNLSKHVIGTSRLYALEFDFKGFFDSISHDYLLEVLNKHFIVSDLDLYVIRSFISCLRADSVYDYKSQNLTRPQSGVPQGTTLLTTKGDW